MRFGSSFAAFAFAIVCSVPVQGQQGTITGRVTDAESGDPLASAAVAVLGQEVTQGTNAQGRFTVTVGPGTYSLVVTLIGYETTRIDGVMVNAGDETEVTISVRSQALALNPVVVTASRRQEKALEAPASISTVSSQEVARRAATTVADHVRSLPGVDAAQTGINQGTVVSRGFNNVFSGALLAIIDNRYARVPSLRFNAYNMFPTNDLDLDRIEVSLGPGAALYGPNASNGVMHLITSSPLDRQGSSISLAGGERSLFHGQFRTAHAPSENFGFKVSAQYMRGNDWEYDDEEEAKARAAGCAICVRDNLAQRYSADARLDFRFAGDADLVLNGGTSTLLTGIDMTGIGAFQVKNWGYNYLQSRFSKGRLFAQAFLNLTNSGSDVGATDPGEGTFGLRTGDPVVDQSTTMAFQFQYGFDLGSRQSFTYGVDWQRTEPKSGGTIFGANEDDDIISEVGAYLHSETSLLDNLDLVTAIRVDDHSRLTDPNVSPRAALVFSPAEEQSFRLTYNRAFATPSSTNLFLDIIANRDILGGALAPLGVQYPVRARGVPQGGYAFSQACPGGFMSYCMHTPVAQGAIPANAALLWDALVDALAGADPVLGLVAPLLKSPGAHPADPEIGTFVGILNTATQAFEPVTSALAEVPALVPTINNTYEVGYKGLIGDRFLLSADVYSTTVDNFVGPLRTITPNVFLEPQSALAFVLNRLAPLIQGGLVTQEQVAALVTQVASVPLGTIGPDGASSPDLLVTYRNYGEVSYWGADLAGRFLVTDKVQLDGSYSFQSEDCFDFEEDGSCIGSQDIALNAPNHKGSFGLTVDDQAAGYTLGARVRFNAGFPMNSGVYLGEVDPYQVVDASIGYRLPFQPAAHVSLTATNILSRQRNSDYDFFGNNRHREFVGAPEIGRMLLLRVRYDF
ncbi:MAG: TonB-dependent receptor [Gemmatimonadota bacterium]|nr:TonB-dependent receptor [Gemmatimonadota bacterium]